MNTSYKNVVPFPMSLVLATWFLCFQTPSRGAEPTPVNLLEQIQAEGARVSEAAGLFVFVAGEGVFLRGGPTQGCDAGATLGL